MKALQAPIYILLCYTLYIDIVVGITLASSLNQHSQEHQEINLTKQSIHNRRSHFYRSYHENRKIKKANSKSNTDTDDTDSNAAKSRNLQDNIFDPNEVVADDHIYIHADDGNDGQDGSTPGKSIKSLKHALTLVKKKSRPLGGNLIVHLSGTFTSQTLKVTSNHKGTSQNKKVIFRGDADGTTRLINGADLKFVKVSSLGTDHPARKLAQSSGTSLNNLWAAAPPSNFPSNTAYLRWPDGDCRDFDGYSSPPTLSLNGQEVLTRAREPNLPPRRASTGPNSMGETRDTWLRTRASDNLGNVLYKSSDESSISKASSASWNSGSVVVHIFPLVDWYDARVAVGARTSSNKFATKTSQKAPGNPEGGKKFKIAKEARYYLEGAVEYLDSAGEYHVSLGEIVGDSKGWTLLYPPVGVDMEGNVKAVLSLEKAPVVKVEGDNMNVSFENLHIEGGRRNLAIVWANLVHFDNCSFINAGHDAVEVYGQKVTFLNCVFEGTGGSSIQLSDDRDIDTDGKYFLLLESGNAIVDSLLSDFASSCRHYSEGAHLGGYGSIVANNHFRSSNMAAIDVVGGGFKMLHNVFSHISNGSYDDGAVHWVAGSPMERGTELAYNVFFRNGVSEEPCNAETSCVQSDVYLDDMAGAMAVHGNVLIKDKVLQSKPPSRAYSVIHWIGIFVNGGADVNVYENSFLGPIDGSSNGAIYKDKAVLFEQTSGGTIWPDGSSCGNTGICGNDPFYKTMRDYAYKTAPWANAYPEVVNYVASPQSGSKWYCANRRTCPLAPWNNTVVCNSGIGPDRALTDRAVWPTDPESVLNDSAVGGETAPRRNEALTESGNKDDDSFNESVDDLDIIESNGMTSVLALASRVASAGEAKSPACSEGTRAHSARSQLAGRLNNPCTQSWIFSGMASCSPCTGSIRCAPRDMPDDKQCSCGSPGPPTAPPPPTTPPTKSPTNSPTYAPTDNNDDDDEDDDGGGDDDSNCIDPITVFKLKGRNRTCNDLHMRKFDSNCDNKQRFKDLCPVVCGICSGSYACVNAKAAFYVEGKKRKCHKATQNDCKKKWVKRICPKACKNTDIC